MNTLLGNELENAKIFTISKERSSIYFLLFFIYFVRLMETPEISVLANYTTLHKK
jgi:hypothetical protein